MLHLGQCLGVVLQPEVDHSRAASPEVGDQRIVGVQHEPRAGRRAGNELGPAVGDQLELAVAVELITEEVGQQQQPRPQLGGNARKPGLVDLEQAELAAPVAGLQQRRGDSQAMLEPARL